jgi:hypothetical protein
MMRMYEDLKEMLCRELEEITRKGEMTTGTLDVVDKLTHAIKSIDTIVAMGRSGYSRGNDGMSGRGRSYDSYGDGMSGARGRGRYADRDSMGRYAGYDSYSYDDAKAGMMSELRELMQSAPDEETKKELRRFIAKLEDK